MTRWSLPSCILFLGIFSLLAESSAADLSQLRRGSTARLVQVGYGPLCKGLVQESSIHQATIKLSEDSRECGSKGVAIRISDSDALEVIAQKRLTRGRLVAKILAGMAGVAVLAAIPLNSSDPESWLLLTNGVFPAFAAYGASKMVPSKREYLIVVACSSCPHCFSNSASSTPETGPETPLKQP